MPSSSSLQSPQPDHHHHVRDRVHGGGDDDRLLAILKSARPFLRGELQSVDPNLPSLVSVLRSVGAGECWHKHGSFLDHLLDVYRILKLWNAPDSVCLCGLFHSAYSNSYVNLAIFDPSTGRDTVRRHVGAAAERLIHLFCVVPRQPLIHDHLLFQYTDAELATHLRLSRNSLDNSRSEGVSDPEEPWRKKLRSLIPPEGIIVKHIKTGEDVRVSRRIAAVFLMMTMADFSDQLFGFQDVLFENSDGRLEFSGNKAAATLWPGSGKPGLWMNSVSRMGALYNLIVREEEIYQMEQKRLLRGSGCDDSLLSAAADGDEEIELVIPPVFEDCTRILDAGEQIEARDLYWEAAGFEIKEESSSSSSSSSKVEEMLVKCVEKNPYVGEPHVVLAQIYLIRGRYEEAQREAGRGLRLLLEWGSPWDKRTSWEGWVAWTRVLLMKAEDKSWPNTSWGILNLGLVR